MLELPGNSGMRQLLTGLLRSRLDSVPTSNLYVATSARLSHTGLWQNTLQTPVGYSSAVCCALRADRWQQAGGQTAAPADTGGVYAVLQHQRLHGAHGQRHHILAVLAEGQRLLHNRRWVGS